MRTIPIDTPIRDGNKVTPEQVAAYLDSVCAGIKARLAAGEPVDVSEELVPPDFATRSVTFTFRNTTPT